MSAEDKYVEVYIWPESDENRGHVSILVHGAEAGPRDLYCSFWPNAIESKNKLKFRSRKLADYVLSRHHGVGEPMFSSYLLDTLFESNSWLEYTQQTSIGPQDHKLYKLLVLDGKCRDANEIAPHDESKGAFLPLPKCEYMWIKPVQPTPIRLYRLQVDKIAKDFLAMEGQYKEFRGIENRLNTNEKTIYLDDSISFVGHLLEKGGIRSLINPPREGNFFSACKTPRSIQALLEKAKEADLNYELGIMYKNGCGVEKNMEIAKLYFTQAHINGHSHATYELGLMYKDGHGVKKDIPKALDYFKQAAAKRHENAIQEIEFHSYRLLYSSRRAFFLNQPEQGKEGSLPSHRGNFWR